MTARSTSSETSCDALRRWARPYAGTQPTLEELARFDRGQRLAVFNAIAPDARARLWREQFTRFAQSPTLSDAQREFVREAIDLATPAFYNRDAAAAASMDALWSRAARSFAREHRGAWFELGYVVRPTAMRAAGEDWCECNHAYGWLECPSGSCPSGGCLDWLGCGISGGNLCNGICAAAK